MTVQGFKLSTKKKEVYEAYNRTREKSPVNTNWDFVSTKVDINLSSN